MASDVKRTISNLFSAYKNGNMLNKLIYINLAVFVLVKLVDIVGMLFNIDMVNPLVSALSVYSGSRLGLTHPWGVATYMFLHQGFLHILFNLLWLFWFGRIFLEYFTDRQLLNVYLCGGLAGALAFILSYNVFPAFDATYASAMGASAAVYAIVLAIAVYVPNYTVYVMFLGQVNIKWIAALSVISDLALLDDGNAGGHIAHMGGAVFGVLYIVFLRKNVDIASWAGKIIDAIVTLFKPRPKMKVTYGRTETDYDYNKRKHDEQKKIDDILEKIAKSGYNGLSDEEKQVLFRNSRNS